MSKSCEHCMYFVRDDLLEYAHGECRKNPPTVGNLVPDFNLDTWTIGVWPLVKKKNWCGEYQGKVHG